MNWAFIAPINFFCTYLNILRAIIIYQRHVLLALPWWRWYLFPNICTEDRLWQIFLQGLVVQVYYPFEVKIWILSCGWWIICPFVNFLKRNIHIFASIINQQTTHHGEIYVKERFGWSIAVLTENRILKS